MRGNTNGYRVTVHHGSLKLNIWRIRLVGRGRTIGNRVTGNTVPEFESLILRQQKGTPIWCPFLLAKNEILTLFEPCYARLQRDVPDRTQWVKQGGLRSGSRRRTQPRLDEGSVMR